MDNLGYNASDMKGLLAMSYKDLRDKSKLKKEERLKKEETNRIKEQVKRKFVDYFVKIEEKLESIGLGFSSSEEDNQNVYILTEFVQFVNHYDINEIKESLDIDLIDINKQLDGEFKDFSVYFDKYGILNFKFHCPNVNAINIIKGLTGWSWDDSTVKKEEIDSVLNKYNDISDYEFANNFIKIVEKNIPQMEEIIETLHEIIIGIE